MALIRTTIFFLLRPRTHFSSFPMQKSLFSTFHQLETHIRVQCSSDDFDKTAALNLFDVMLSSNPSPSVSSFNNLLTRVRGLRDYPLVVWIYKTALAADILFPDVYTHGILIDSFCRSGRLDLGFGMLGDLIKRGLNPNVVVLNSLIHGLSKHSNSRNSSNSSSIRDVVELFERMPELGCTPSAATYGVLISCYCKNHQIDSGLAVLGCMMRSGCQPNLTILNTLVYGFFKSKNIFDVIHMLRRRTTTTLDMDFTTDLITYNTIFSYCFQNNFLNIGFGIFTKLLKDGIKPNIITLNSLIHGLCEADKLVEATTAVSRFPQMGVEPDVITYGTLINGHFRYSRNNNAHTVKLGFGIFGEMLKRGHCFNAIIYTTMVKGLCVINRADEASDLVEMMYTKLGISPDVITYNTLINGLCCIGDTQAALKLLREMGSDKKIHWCEPDKVTYTTIIHSLCRLGEMDEAVKVLEEMDGSNDFT
ncbi:hypothetical protein ZOSMA_67G00080 [Zostera marina]|uniref:Pentatricopeptide repeat-containing protein n=1 Tax=Zostera marina TaxID=29655 RepID=A0A0K9NTY1_ZOSMR|nr:hypothetical protein ZOSMA_67G00080 [Zostera marina]